MKRISIEEKVNIWKRIASDLQKPTRKRRIVNLSRINRYAKENDTIVVPGKVLANGELDHKLTIAAYTFSGEALKKIKESGCIAMNIPELLEKNPKANKIRIIG